MEAGYIVNKKWDKLLNEERYENPEKFIYPLKRGDKPKNQYAAKWYKIPNVEYSIEFDTGNLKRYDLSS